MKQLADKLAQVMDQLDDVDQDAFMALMADALEPYPELGWELGPDPEDGDLMRLSLVVRDAPAFRDEAAETDAFPVDGEGWRIDLGVPPRDADIYLEAQVGEGEDAAVLEIEGEQLGWQMRGGDGVVDLVVGIPAGPLRQLGAEEREELADIFVMGELGEINLMDYVNSISVEDMEALSEQWPSLTTLRRAFVARYPDCAYAEWMRTSRD